MSIDYVCWYYCLVILRRRLGAGSTAFPRWERSSRPFPLTVGAVDLLHFDAVANELLPALLIWLNVTGISTQQTIFQSFSGAVMVALVTFLSSFAAARKFALKACDSSKGGRSIAVLHQRNYMSWYELMWVVQNDDGTKARQNFRFQQYHQVFFSESKV